MHCVLLPFRCQSPLTSIHVFVWPSPPDGVRLPASSNLGAVERALRDAGDRKDGHIFDLTPGKIFESTQEAYEFYNMYSWEKGFGIRYGRSKQRTCGTRTMQDFVCACEVCRMGFCTQNPRFELSN
jgi:hypothetical protein